MEDQGIIALFFDRSEQAIEETDKKYGGYCYSIAYNILFNREDSEECVSDTYLAAWNTIPPRRPNFLNAFLAKMTRHISIDRWRKRSAKKRGGGEIFLALEELEDCVDSSSTETEYEKKELSRVLNQFLSIFILSSGDRAECVPVPVLVSGFHPDHFRGFRFQSEQGDFHAPSAAWETAEKAQ